MRSSTRYVRYVWFWIFVAFPAQGFCWGAIGHGAVAEIAERKLTPKAKALAMNIIGIEPLAVAASWADYVKSDSRFSDFSPYHYIEVPIGKKYEELSNDKIAERNAHTIIIKAQEILSSDKGYTRDQKMILLRYLIHVVGDVHQPLHIGNGYDRGANLCDVKIKGFEAAEATGAFKVSEATIQNLHSVWDDLLIDRIGLNWKKETKKHWFGYKEFADMIERELAGSQTFEVISKTPVLDWYEESQKYHPVVYLDSTPVAPEKRAYCKKEGKAGKIENGFYDENQIPTLDEAYISKANALIKLQVLRAGYRLAGLLNALAEPMTIPTPRKEADVLKEILFTNKNVPRTSANKNVPRKPHKSVKH